MVFGDTRQGDQIQLQMTSGPNEFEAAMEPWIELLGSIGQDLERLEGDLADMRVESQRLEKAGMYPAIPSESWEGRNGGEAIYLRMVFPRGTPGVRRKEYIGNKPAAIADARRLAANRRRWEELEQAIIQLERFLRMSRVELANLARRLAHYQVPEEIASLRSQ